jgi:hypothetical protein
VLSKKKDEDETREAGIIASFPQSFFTNYKDQLVYELFENLKNQQIEDFHKVFYASSIIDELSVHFTGF